VANPEHLEFLRQGIEAWNAWRRESPEIQPNFSQCQLQELICELDHRPEGSRPTCL
jgi:hypothetical protein